jgi:hypothetical protein
LQRESDKMEVVRTSHLIVARYTDWRIQCVYNW